MKSAVRCQAAILQDDHMLLLMVWDHVLSGKIFWVMPGGARLPGETREECVRREVLEETHLEVEVDRLILDLPDLPPPQGIYQRVRTYVCTIIQGDPQPGVEPEVDSTNKTTIKELGWFDLRNQHSWDPLALDDPVTYENLQRVRRVLGYAAGSS